MNRVHFSTQTDLWATPQWLFDQLAKEFPMTTDVCAIPENAKCSRFFTPEMNGLTQDWRGVCWMNPPFGGRGKIDPWIQKAYEAAKTGATVVCLVPARPGSPWFFNVCSRGEVRFLKGKLTFGGAETVAPFNSAVVIFRGRRKSCRFVEMRKPKP